MVATWVPSDLHEAADAIQQEAAAISECAEHINAVGAEVKVHWRKAAGFPGQARRRGRPPLLEAWRGRDSLLAPERRGIRGRKPIVVRAGAFESVEHRKEDAAAVE